MWEASLSPPCLHFWDAAPASMYPVIFIFILITCTLLSYLLDIASLSYLSSYLFTFWYRIIILSFIFSFDIVTLSYLSSYLFILSLWPLHPHYLLSQHSCSQKDLIVCSFMQKQVNNSQTLRAEGLHLEVEFHIGFKGLKLSKPFSNKFTKTRSCTS